MTQMLHEKIAASQKTLTPETAMKNSVKVSNRFGNNIAEIQNKVARKGQVKQSDFPKIAQSLDYVLEKIAEDDTDKSQKRKKFLKRLAIGAGIAGAAIGGGALANNYLKNSGKLPNVTKLVDKIKPSSVVNSYKKNRSFSPGGSKYEDIARRVNEKREKARSFADMANKMEAANVGKSSPINKDRIDALRSKSRTIDNIADKHTSFLEHRQGKDKIGKIKSLIKSPGAIMTVAPMALSAASSMVPRQKTNVDIDDDNGQNNSTKKKSTKLKK